MSYENRLKRLRGIYQRLIQLFPDAYMARVGEAMLDTFDDLANERQKTNRSLTFVIELYADVVFHVVKENLMAAKESQALAVISAVLLIPFALIFPISLIWQSLESLGLVGMPTLWTAFSGTRMAYVLLFVFPGAALILSLGNLVVRATRVGISHAASMGFVRSNVLVISLVVLSAGASLFLYGHDVLPCALWVIISGNWVNLGPALQACMQA